MEARRNSGEGSEVGDKDKQLQLPIETAAAAVKVKIDGVSKFDGTQPHFNRYHIKLKAAAKLNGCKKVLKMSTADVKEKLEGGDAALENLLETLFTIIILTIDDTVATGEELLTILSAQCEADDKERICDDGHKAYQLLVSRYAGESNSDTTSLFRELNNTKLNGDDVQKYESEIISLFTRVNTAGTDLGDDQKKAFFLTGLEGQPRWEFFVQHMHQFDAMTEKKSDFNMLLAMFHTMSPIIMSMGNNDGSQAYSIKENHAKKELDKTTACYRCGGTMEPKGHAPHECPAKDRNCYKCGNPGHLSPMCTTKSNKVGKGKGKGRGEGRAGGKGSRDDKALAAVLTKISNKSDKQFKELSEQFKALKVNEGDGDTSSAVKDKKEKYNSGEDTIEFAGAHFKVSEENKAKKPESGFSFCSINKMVMLLSTLILLTSCGVQWLFVEPSLANSEIDTVKVSNEANYEIWQHDSGSTSHMTGTAASDWNNYTPIAGARAKGVGGMVETKGRANQVRYMETTEGKFIRIKMEVKHVPALGTEHPLLSEPAIEDTTSLELHTRTMRSGKKTWKEKYYSTPDGDEIKLMRVGREYLIKLYKTAPNDNHDFCNVSIDDLDKLTLQHLRLGHRNQSNLIAAVEKGAITGADIGDVYQVKKNLKNQTLPHVCEGCEFGKKHKAPASKEKAERATKRLQLVHMGWVGPIATPSVVHHCIYALVFTDDLTRVSRVYCTRKKSDGLDAFKKYRKDVEDENHSVQVLQADNAPEFMKGKFGSYCVEHGINQRWSLPYRQWQNGVAERVNRTLCEMANCMMHTTGLSRGYWELALKHAVYVYNRSMHKSLPDITPYEAWHGTVPDVSNLKIFGSPAYIGVEKPNRDGKFTYTNATKGLYVGHSLCHKNSSLVYIPNKNVVVARMQKEVTVNERAVFEGETEQVIEDSDPFLLDVSKDNSEFFNSSNLEPESPAENLMAHPPKPRVEGETHQRQPVFVAPAVGRPQSLNFDSVEIDRTVEASGGPSNEAIAENSKTQKKLDRLARNLGSRGNDGKRLGSHFRNPFYDKVCRVSFTLLALTDYALMTKTVATGAVDLASNYTTPKTYNQAVNFGSQEVKTKWVESIHKELSGLENCGCWELADLPPNRKSIGAKWVFKVKETSTGEVDKFKARCVAKGYSQIYGVDFDETYAPVCKSTSVNHLLALSTQKNLTLDHMDVHQAFIQSPMEEEIYLELPDGYAEWKNCSSNKVLRIKKGLYGLKQSGRSWNKTIEKTFNELGFERFESDVCLFKKTIDGETLYITLYVDDLIIAAPNTKSGQEKKIACKKELQDKYQMTDLGKLSWFLGMKISQSGDCSTVSIDQSKYIEDVASKFGVTDGTKYSTPMDENLKLSRQDAPKIGSPEHDEASKLPYKELIGCLLYISGKSRPDVTYAVHLLARFSMFPSLKSYNAALRVLSYLHQTKDEKLTYSKYGNSEIEVLSESKQASNSAKTITAWADSNWGGDPDTMRSTTGYVVMYAGAAISWNSRLQPTVALSSTEAEYMACTSVLQDVMHHRMLHEEFGYGINEPTVIMEDNQGCIHMAKAQGNHKRVKHLDLKVHFVRQAVDAGTVVLDYISTNDQLADTFTKALPRQRFIQLRNKILNIGTS